MIRHEPLDYREFVEFDAERQRQRELDDWRLEHLPPEANGFVPVDDEETKEDQSDE